MVCAYISQKKTKYDKEDNTILWLDNGIPMYPRALKDHLEASKTTRVYTTSTSRR